MKVLKGSHRGRQLLLSDLRTMILELKNGLEQAGFVDQAYLESSSMRLNLLKKFRENNGWLTDTLTWLMVTKHSTPA
jgi:hypothetical protein